jgi:acetolactate decarboxylase
VLDPRLAAAAHSAVHGVVHQVEPIHDLMCGNYDAVTTVAESFKGTHLGLGVAEACDGEIVSVDGSTWRIPATGVAEPAPADLGLAFAVAASSGQPVDIPIVNPIPITGLANLIAEILQVERCGVAAVRVDGDFVDVVLRSEARQHEPYRPLSKVLADEVRFTFTTWSGTLVGFFFADTDADVVIPSLHLHAISTDRRTGGHCHGATVQRGTLQVWLDAAEIGVAHGGILARP